MILICTCYQIFRDVLYPIVREYHGFDPALDAHTANLDSSVLTVSKHQSDLLRGHVTSSRIETHRNLSGYPLIAGINADQRASVESVLCQAFDRFDGNLKGSYYPLASIPAHLAESLQYEGGGLLFDQSCGDPSIMAYVGGQSEWPENRGLFCTDDRSCVCWCNEEDHCRILVHQLGGDLLSSFTQFFAVCSQLETSVMQNGNNFM